MPRQTPALNLLRLPLLALAASTALSSALWLLIGLPFTAPAGLDALEHTHWPAFARATSSAAAKSITAGPALFTSSTGPNAVPEVKVLLKGIARGPRDQAALLSIGGAQATWLSVGQSRDGVTLVSVTPSQILMDTALGFREVSLAKPDLVVPPASTASLQAQKGHR